MTSHSWCMMMIDERLDNRLSVSINIAIIMKKMLVDISHNLFSREPLINSWQIVTYLSSHALWLSCTYLSRLSFVPHHWLMVGDTIYYMTPTWFPYRFTSPAFSGKYCIVWLDVKQWLTMAQLLCHVPLHRDRGAMYAENVHSISCNVTWPGRIKDVEQRSD